MFNAIEVDRDIREIHLLIDMQLNLFVQNLKPLFLAVSPAVVVRTR